MKCRNILGLFWIAGIGIVGSGLAARRWYHRWGATDEEISRVMPSDERVPNPTMWPMYALIDPGAFIMERKMLLEIKRLAETAST